MTVALVVAIALAFAFAATYGVPAARATCAAAHATHDAPRAPSGLPRV
jgi:hypothetical protein